MTVNTVTVTESLRRQGLAGRPVKRRRGLTQAGQGRRRSSRTLLKQDFTAPAPNVKWVGDMSEIPTGEGKLYLP